MAESRRGQAREEYEPELAASHQRWVDLGEEVVDAMTDKFVGEAFDRPKTLPMCVKRLRLHISDSSYGRFGSHKDRLEPRAR